MTDKTTTEIITQKAEQALKQSDINKVPGFNAVLHYPADGRVLLYFDSERTQRDDIHEHNWLTEMVSCLRAAGLRVCSDGPAPTLIEDLRRHHPAELKLR